MHHPIITGRNEVVATVMFLHVSVILLTGGAIPACIAGGIPACLAAGLLGGAIPACIAGGIPACLAAGLLGELLSQHALQQVLWGCSHGSACSWGVPALGGAWSGGFVWPSVMAF